MRKIRSGLLLLCLVLVAAACRKLPDPVAATLPPIDHGGIEAPGFRVQFTPTVSGVPLVMDSAWYRNAAGDSFRVSEHKYYVSNFVLHSADGATIPLPETYFLVDARSVRPRGIRAVPPGTYNRISFLLGVDSARNVSGAQTGDLEQSKGMFWDWDAGYIMAKTEGQSPQSVLSGGVFYFHITGFAGKYNALRTVTLDLPMPLEVKAGTQPTLQLQSDLASWFSGPSPFGFADFSSVMVPGPQAAAIADNYSKGIRVVRIDP